MVLEKDIIRYIYDHLHNYIHYEHNFCVSKEKDIYHKFFIVNISMHKNKRIRNLLIELPNNYQKIDNEDRINSIEWLSKKDFFTNKNKIDSSTRLLRYFYTNLH